MKNSYQNTKTTAEGLSLISFEIDRCIDFDTRFSVFEEHNFPLLRELGMWINGGEVITIINALKETIIKQKTK